MYNVASIPINSGSFFSGNMIACFTQARGHLGRAGEGFLIKIRIYTRPKEPLLCLLGPASSLIQAEANKPQVIHTSFNHLLSKFPSLNAPQLLFLSILQPEPSSTSFPPHDLIPSQADCSQNGSDAELVLQTLIIPTEIAVLESRHGLAGCKTGVGWEHTKLTVLRSGGELLHMAPF